MPPSYRESQSPRWAFFTHAYNLGDCSRAVEVAKAMRSTGANVTFFHRGGTYVDWIADAGFEPVGIEPFITPEQNTTLMDMDQHRAPIGTPLPYTESQWLAMIESERAALGALAPDGVYAGLNLSCMTSVPSLKLPMVTLVPTALCPAFFHAKLASFPDAMDSKLLRHLVPKWAKRQVINRVMLGDVARKSAEILNRVRQRYALAPIFNFTSLVRGDLTLLPDLPELSGLPAESLPHGYAYSGPLFARTDLPVPPEVHRVFSRSGRKIYCAMGSSVPPALMKEVITILRSLPDTNVVCATAGVVDPDALGEGSDDFFAAKFLPAASVSELADIAVTHGGQGTVQTAVWAGTPVVGFGMQWEQQANLDGLARAGAAVRIPLYDVTRPNIVKALADVSTPQYRHQVSRLRDLVRRTDGATEATRLMNGLLRSSTAVARLSVDRSGTGGDCESW